MPDTAGLQNWLPSWPLTEKSEKIARRSFQRLADIESSMRSDFNKDENEIAEKYTPIDWENIKIGDKVKVKIFDFDGYDYKGECL